MSGAALKRRIGLGLLTLYGVGVMIGAGIYVLVGAVAAEAGAFAPMAFAVAGLIAAFTAASFAELSARIPESAGEAAYAEAAFGKPALSLGVGLAVALVGVISAAAVLRGGVGYLASLIDVSRPVLILGLGVLLAGLAIWGVVESLAFAGILTLIEVVGLLVVAGAGVIDPTPALNVSEMIPGAAGWPTLAGLAGGAFLAFFAFIGFEDMVNMAEETRDPQRTLPRAILLAMLIAMLLYMLVAIAAVRAAGVEALAASDRPLALAFEAATQKSAGFIALIAVAAALNGVLAQMVMAARVLFGLGRRHGVMRVFHRAHPRFGTPVLATVLAAGIAVVLALVAPVDQLAKLTTAILLIIFTLMNVALIKLKHEGPAPEGAPDLPALVPWLGAGLSLATLVAALLTGGAG